MNIPDRYAELLSTALSTYLNDRWVEYSDNRDNPEYFDVVYDLTPDQMCSLLADQEPAIEEMLKICSDTRLSP